MAVETAPNVVLEAADLISEERANLVLVLVAADWIGARCETERRAAGLAEVLALAAKRERVGVGGNARRAIGTDRSIDFSVERVFSSGVGREGVERVMTRLQRAAGCGCHVPGVLVVCVECHGNSYGWE
jgi:hypothetical protein